MIRWRDAATAAEHHPGARRFMIMRRYIRHIAAQTRHHLAGAAPMPPAFLTQTDPPELQHVGVEPRRNLLRGVARNRLFSGEAIALSNWIASLRSQ